MANKTYIYKGHNIYALFPSGYFETYLNGRFVKADTLEGAKALIDANQ